MFCRRRRWQFLKIRVNKRKLKKKGGEKEMKKLIAVALAVALVITLFAVIAPASGKSQPGEVRSVFESDFVPALEVGDYSFVKGEVCVREDGSVKVEIEGVEKEGVPPTDETFIVKMYYGKPGPWEFQTTLGMIEIDADGYGVLETSLAKAVQPVYGRVPTPTFVIATPVPGGSPPPPPIPRFVNSFQAPPQ